MRAIRHVPWQHGRDVISSKMHHASDFLPPGRVRASAYLILRNVANGYYVLLLTSHNAMRRVGMNDNFISLSIYFTLQLHHYMLIQCFLF
jgi:hypothetical protein